MNTPRQQGIRLIEEVLKELENSKGSISTAVNKLRRTAVLLDEKDLLIWCDIQLGKPEYVTVLQRFINSYKKNDLNKTKETEKELSGAYKAVEDEGIELLKHITNEELSAKSNESNGGFAKIDFIEERYNDLVRSKKGNDGTYYKTNLYSTLSLTKSIAHRYATDIYKNYAFKELAETNFELLKKEVEDVLFNLDPELAEKLMLSFKSVSSDNPEEWSHSLTTCRRFFEQLADKLYPAVEDKVGGRALGKNNYINRIWAFMDKSIESESDRALAKVHVDFLGSYLQNLYRISNKGVHAGLKRVEALKAVMHIYLLCADILGYLDQKDLSKSNGKLNIHNATLDELESLGCITRTIAKEIVRLRVNNSEVTHELLKTIPKLSAKGLKSLEDNFVFNPLSK